MESRDLITTTQITPSQSLVMPNRREMRQLTQGLTRQQRKEVKDTAQKLVCHGLKSQATIGTLTSISNQATMAYKQTVMVTKQEMRELSDAGLLDQQDLEVLTALNDDTAAQIQQASHTGMSAANRVLSRATV